MAYDVPFISQFEGLTDPQWRWRGCGIVALKMVMDYWHSEDPSCTNPETQTLMTEGLEIGAYREGIGWTHGGLAALARAYGYRAYNRDLALNGPTPMSREEAFSEMERELRDGPVLASVYSGLEPERGGGHIVVVTGIQDDMVEFNDPEQQDQREGRRTLAVSVFKKAFKQRYVCVFPKP